MGKLSANDIDQHSFLLSVPEFLCHAGRRLSDEENFVYHFDGLFSTPYTSANKTSKSKQDKETNNIYVSPSTIPSLQDVVNASSTVGSPFC